MGLAYQRRQGIRQRGCLRCDALSRILSGSGFVPGTFERGLRDWRGYAVARPGNRRDLHRAQSVAGRWQMAVELVANLRQVPASGATACVGAAKMRGATGGPVRMLAVW